MLRSVPSNSVFYIDKSDQRRWYLLTASIGWLGLTVFGFWYDARYEPIEGWLADVLLGAMVVGQLALIFDTLAHWLRHFRFRGGRLRLDPFPVSIGGHLGGELVLPLRYGQGAFVDVRVTCVRKRFVGNGISSRHRVETDVLWREEARAHGIPAAGGTRFGFVLPVPAGLPPSGGDARDLVIWRIQILRELSGADIDYEFEFRAADGPARYSSIPSADGPGRHAVAEFPQSVLTLEPDGEGIRLFYPRVRGFKKALMLSAFVIALGGISLYVARYLPMYQSDGESLHAGFLLAVFLWLLPMSLLGLYGGYISFYNFVNTLEVRIAPGGVHVTRDILGMRFSKQAARGDIVSLVYDSGAHGSGNFGGAREREKIDFRLFAITGKGEKICLGDGIAGISLARGVMREISKVLNMEEWAAL